MALAKNHKGGSANKISALINFVATATNQRYKVGARNLKLNQFYSVRIGSKAKSLAFDIFGRANIWIQHLRMPGRDVSYVRVLMHTSTKV